MPQVDLETLVCGGDRKIACESLIEDQQNPPPDKPDPPEVPPDFPTESFHEEDELDWADRNAIYFDERKDSHKVKSNPSSNSISNPNPNRNSNSNSNSSSQRFSLKFTSNASIIGLPKPHKPTFVNSKSRRHGRPPRPRFFPKKPSRSGKSLTFTEPSSPKVSCIGRVRSNKGRNRRSRSGRRSTEINSKPENKTGFWSSCFNAILQSFSCPKNGSGVDIDEHKRPNDNDSASPSPPRWSFAEREQKISMSAPLGDPPGLGGMKRFASGRKSESWGSSDFDLEESVVESDAPDHEQNSIWHRRGVGPPKKIDSLHDWESDGPASV
ncbi:uncharacterized protein LOC122058232 [Macadamia integrifolia]|uniref:uncharacterized protein LOC122058232 n=1 Tax=Macadamia integrifolia TaxID=60698 RepID=UPI001C53049E|nr:uncharacterized protein LOC122058232 [Macadamia integrifolia]